MRKKMNTVTLLLLVGVLTYGAISLASAAAELQDAMEMTETLVREIEDAERENRTLSEKAESIDGEDAVRAGARDTFGFTDSHEIIFVDMN